MIPRRPVLRRRDLRRHHLRPDLAAGRERALADQPALTFNAPTGFPADQPTTGSPIVTNSPPALGRPRTPIVILPGAQSRRAAPPPRRRAGSASEEGRRADGRKALAARRLG